MGTMKNVDIMQGDEITAMLARLGLPETEQVPLKMYELMKLLAEFGALPATLRHLGELIRERRVWNMISDIESKTGASIEIGMIKFKPE
jgi:hypothetical protein